MSAVQIAFTGLSLDILKRESWTHVGRTANIIIKDVIHIFASISKTMRILLMGRRNRERWFSTLSVSIFSKVNQCIMDPTILVKAKCQNNLEAIYSSWQHHVNQSISCTPKENHDLLLFFHLCKILQNLQLISTHFSIKSYKVDSLFFPQFIATFRVGARHFQNGVLGPINFWKMGSRLENWSPKNLLIIFFFIFYMT